MLPKSDERGQKVSQQTDKTGSGNGRGKAPVNAHPMFPAIVALWFAALFGLGSLAIRPALIESAVLATRIDALVPAAAPPLGVTARILFALVLAVVGGLLGAAIARRIARPTPVAKPRRRGAANLGETAPNVRLRGRDSHPDAPARLPISAHDELGDDGIDSEEPVQTPLPGRRRALTVVDDAGDGFYDFAPLPGGAPQILDLAELDAGAALDAPEAVEAEPVAVAVTQPEISVEVKVAPPVVAEASLAPITPAAQITDAPLGELGLVALTERFALALQRRREAEAARAAAAVTAAEVVDAPAIYAEVVAKVEADLPTAPMAIPAAFRPLTFDEPVEDELDSYADFLPLRRMTTSTEVTPEPEFQAEAESQIEPTAEVEPDTEEADDELDGYSSLLDLSLPAAPRQTFVRIEEPEEAEAEIEPVVIFPGHAARQSVAPEAAAAGPGLRPFDPPTLAATGQPIAAATPIAASDPEETERALRAALATLQRMSGAA